MQSQESGEKKNSFKLLEGVKGKKTLSLQIKLEN